MSVNVLIVDDERRVRLNYRVTLETEGYKIFEAVSGAGTLEALLGRPFDVAILNLAGVLAETLDDVDKAKKYCGQAIRLNKNYEPAQQNMRRLFELENFGATSELLNLGEN